MDLDFFKELNKEENVDYLIQMFKDSNEVFEEERESIIRQDIKNFYLNFESFYSYNPS